MCTSLPENLPKCRFAVLGSRLPVAFHFVSIYALGVHIGAVTDDQLLEAFRNFLVDGHKLFFL